MSAQGEKTFGPVPTLIWRAGGFAGPNALPVPRWRIAAKFAAMRLRSARHGAEPAQERIFGRIMEADNYETLLYLYFEVFALQEYAFESSKRAPHIIDAGANIGMATLFFKVIFPAATIEAFEPSPASFRLLERNVAANGLAGVRLHNAALAGTAGVTSFYVETADETSLIASTRPGRGARQRIEVEAVTLSSQIESEVDLLKLDVEGSEAEVLEEVAASGKLSLVREMLIEYHHNIPGNDGRFSAFLALLEDHGFDYRVRAAERVFRDPEAVQDVLVWAYRPH
jgi:FkbM family methyltransferase